ncbi:MULTISPECIES: cobaltochelatase subunit CobN [Ensifer]|jgi:cobaltochelatase CobN|uniref:Cobaltochelatase subunit CobN n=1 Tax=Ensifer canadensis TaxID=555315 RepID=A0AAW4FQ06_9HYPH|nr:MULTISPECIES: cobaltochelatase subunit CobN [Ensifer]MDP9630817.1 cobaltochelatase CobN [Ensifer adhaerens]KQU86173.1 cobalamin biosynthesis protein CobN [Ensifer sp. Root31]KQW74447.1 cobalamin biosynthesis protein CobN [Ensifer sp. Root127]KQY62144.1 cobalamin biosynthesis protein CobN [Ensifer sp. Root142]MBM3093415.1 cobaltochelatase subunit CobN [Ensifer canadensis]
MHLLLAQKGTIADGNEAIDLGQTPADVLFLSAADTELSSIAAAHGRRDGELSLRIASLMNLMHPMSVDTYVERTARHAKLIVVRPLGGASYFRYVLEALHAAAVTHRFQIAVLPGDDKPDPGLEPFSTVEADDRQRLWAYFTEGGADNAGLFLDYAEALISDAEKPQPAKPLLKAGIWWPGAGVIGVSEWKARVQERMVAGEGFEPPTVGICFYRALVQSGETRPVEALIEALAAEGMRVLPLFVSSLKDAVSVGTLQSIFSEAAPDVVMNATGFAVSSPGADRQPTVLESTGAPVLQVIFSGSSRAQWQASPQGLMARDLAMNVALPEVDGRILARAVSFKAASIYDPKVEANIVGHEPLSDRVRFAARLAVNWAKLRRARPAERRIAIIMANYPNRDGRLGNGVGLDTPAGTVEVLRAMASEGYPVAGVPEDGDALIGYLMAGPTNAASRDREIREVLSFSDYNTFFDSLPKQIQDEVSDRWGAPETDPFFLDGAFALPLARFGEIVVGIQPARGYNIDPKESYHSPDLVPPHGYLAFYAFLRNQFGAQAIVHMGKHGNLEWLPGKALALSETCYPEAIFGPLPHVYPFIVNDPGEGTQAKRRTSAVIIDHLTPPLTRAESYGPLKDLEALVDEYYDAAGGDPRRLRLLSRQILDLVRDIGLDHDAGIDKGDSDDKALEKLDAYLCDLKEMQIRDGLHIFGVAPEGRLLTDLTVALARVPRSLGEGADQSLQRAMAADAGLGFDPLDCVMSDPWEGARPDMLSSISDAPWRTAGDTVERIELLAAAFVSGETLAPEDWPATRTVLGEIEARLKPSIINSGAAEMAGFLTGLDGRFVAPGPSGAPTRGRPDVLPTGRNFYSVDSRSVPTPAAFELGKKSAELLIRRYLQDHGEWPSSFGLTAWGTANMRTGGDDIAQALALIGTKPTWDMVSRRVMGYEIVPLAMLGRPRVDVTLRISGFFRDAFPDQIALFDKAIRAVGALEEDDADNMIAARMRAETQRLEASGVEPAEAARRASYRVFGAKPGAYGAGLQALIDEKGWDSKADLADAYLTWGAYAYGAGEEGKAGRELFEERLRTIEAVVQNQDNREHDLLDSDDYYQFEGGMSLAAEHLSGARPAIYHNDHSRPEKPVIRSLEEEIGRVVRARVVNPKWIDGVMRHGYKGAFEIAATVDYMFAFAATTGAVRDHHFEAAYQAFIVDERVSGFLRDKNPAALAELSERLLEAIDRNLWIPRSNSARFELSGRTTAAVRLRAGNE